MSIRSKDEERDMKRSRNRKVIRLEGSPSDLELSFKYLKVELKRDLFFPGKTCKPFLLVRGTISFYNQKLQLLPAGESEMWNVSM